MTLAEYKEFVREEINQRRDEGAGVSAWAADLEALGASEDEAEWGALYERLYAEPVSINDDREPSTLDAIRALRLQAERSFPVDEAALPDRLLGAWHGRIAGCILGATVEGKPKTYVDRYLQAAGMADLDHFFPRLEEWPDGFDLGWLNSERVQGTFHGRINGAIRDDDIDYTILGLHYLERFGPGFTADDVAMSWQALLPYAEVFTAERVAYRNLVNGLCPPQTATHRNPYREWIGAQIRADAFGYVNAGHPEAAAGFAFRDASVSHTKNGIYGEMWSAAMVAAAFSTDSPRIAIEAGLAEIPADSRLAQAGRKLLAWSEEFPTWEGCWSRAREDYGNLHWVHTINNALWVMVGLLYGGKDFGKTISIAVRCGDDTDCNGATAGSVIGAILGAKAIPAQWVDPFQDKVRSCVFGFDGSRISDLANRTLVQYRRVKDAR
ncbi:MAG TPA: ADP-ribosylglycohydrolase family protein [Armatimonadota bacterium]|jgi:hypothetical protein